MKEAKTQILQWKIHEMMETVEASFSILLKMFPYVFKLYIVNSIFYYF